MAVAPAAPVFHIAVGVAGDDAGSVAAFDTAASFCRKGYKLTIVIIPPSTDKKSGIESYFSTRAVSRLSPGSYTIMTLPAPAAGQDWRSVLTRFVTTALPGLAVLVVPYLAMGGGSDMVDASNRAAGTIHSVVVKNSGAVGVDSCLYVACTDGSPKGDEGIDLVQKLVRPSDKITILFADDPGKKSAGEPVDIDAKYEEYCKVNTNAEYVKLPKGPAADAILDYIADVGAHYVAIGVEGAAALAAGLSIRLGGKSDTIVKKARCSVICVQEGKSTFTDAEVRSAAGNRASIRVFGGLLKRAGSTLGGGMGK